MDVTAILRPGVYILRNQRRVVFVGAGKLPLARVYAHAAFRRGDTAPSWFPIHQIAFDAEGLRPCRVEELGATLASVQAEVGWSPPTQTRVDWNRSLANV